MSLDQAIQDAPVDTTLTAWRGEPTAAEYFARNIQTANYFAKNAHKGAEAQAWSHGPSGQWCAAYTTQIFRNSGYSELISKCPNTNLTGAVIQNGINQGWGGDTKDGQLPPVGSIVSMYGQGHTLSVVGTDEKNHTITVADGNWGNQASVRTISVKQIDEKYVSGAKMAHHLFTMGIAPTPLAAHESEIAKASAPTHFDNVRASIPSQHPLASTELAHPMQTAEALKVPEVKTAFAGLGGVLHEIDAMRQKLAGRVALQDINLPMTWLLPIP